MLRSFTTKATTRIERSRQWRALTQAEYVEFDDDREASIRGGDFGALRLCLVSMGRHRVVQANACSNALQAPRAFKLLFQEEGSAVIHQSGRSNQMKPGQWCAIRKDIPFTIDAPVHSRQLAMTVPCNLLAVPERGIDWWRQSRSFLLGPAQILHASASASVISARTLRADDCEQLGGQIAMLMQMTLRADDIGDLRDVREARRVAVLDYVDQHLSEDELDVATIARAFGISTRSVHKLFEGEAQTITRVIWDKRLERCRDEMIDPSLTGRSITEIAHLWGFSDSQHFSRTFKQRFGLTPRDYRNLFSLH